MSARPAVVDAHHHLWDPTKAEYPWMTDSVAAIRRPFGTEDLRPLLAENGVEATVVVQARPSLEETHQLLEVAAASGFIAGVVGWVNLSSPDVAASLAELKGGLNGRFLVGVRHQVHDEPDPEWLLRPEVRRGLRSVQEADLAYDLLVRPRELPAALAIAREFDQLRLVIDHLAKPTIAAGRDQVWADRIRPFGELPNVHCKVSGLVTEADWRRWRPSHLRPFIDVALEWFGEDRLMFGSDWPVCLLAASYGEVMAALLEVVGEDPGLMRKVLSENAAGFYQLDRNFSA